MARLGNIGVGGTNPVRIMGILNVSPESFHKKSVFTGKIQIKNAVKLMESQGADFIDVGGMSTAPYLSTVIPEETESKRVINAVKIIQNFTNIPISVDTCRSSVAKDALECGVKIINDVSGLKHDRLMPRVISEFSPFVILCAYSQKPVSGTIPVTKRLLKESLGIAVRYGVPPSKIVLDPAIGFFRKTGKGPFYTKIESDWTSRDIAVLNNLESIKQGHPILVSVSNKSFIGKILEREDTTDRLPGSIAAETVSVLHGADVIRTHNVQATRDAVLVASRIVKRQHKGL